MNRYELCPTDDMNVKSFYRKAYVEIKSDGSNPYIYTGDYPLEFMNKLDKKWIITPCGKPTPWEDIKCFYCEERK